VTPRGLPLDALRQRLEAPLGMDERADSRGQGPRVAEVHARIARMPSIGP